MAMERGVMRGKRFIDSDGTTKNVRAEGNRRGWKHGNDISPEIACLIREKFTDEELEAMGLWWIVVMHEPINDSDGDPNLLSAFRYDDGRWLDADVDRPGYEWDDDGGFAFVIPQVAGTQH